MSLPFFVPELWPKKGVPETVPDGAFRYFLEKLSLILADFRAERGSYGPRYVCEVWSPGKIIFMNYWQKGESKWPKIVVSAYKSKRLVQIFLISCMCIEVDSGLISSQTACRYHFSFWSYPLKWGVKMSRNQTLRNIS